MKQTDMDIWNKAVELVGMETMEKLSRHGFVVADQRSLDDFLEEQRKSNARIRETAAAAMRAIGIDTFRLELVVTDGTPTIIATAPSGNEKELARVAAGAIASAWIPPGGWTEATPQESHLSETTDVAVYGTASEPSERLSSLAAMITVAGEFINVYKPDGNFIVQLSCENHEIAMRDAEFLKQWAVAIARDVAEVLHLGKGKERR